MIPTVKELIGLRVVANKVITMGGVFYSPGDPVDTSAMSHHKVGQLLNRRILRPAPDAVPVAEPDEPVMKPAVDEVAETEADEEEPVMGGTGTESQENTDEEA